MEIESENSKFTNKEVFESGESEFEVTEFELLKEETLVQLENEKMKEICVLEKNQ